MQINKFFLPVALLALCAVSQPSVAGPILADPSFISGPPPQLQIDFQDPADGLSGIIVTQSQNADTVVPPFLPGTTDPITTTSTIINQALDALVEIQVTSTDNTTQQFTFSFNANGITAASTVPEPATLGLIGTALLAYPFVRRRKRSLRKAA